REAGRRGRGRGGWVARAMKIVVADGLAPEGLERLRASFDVVVESGLSDDALPVALADAEAVIVRSRTRITAAAIVRARRLRVIARAGVGTDNIDVEAATHRGILVLTTPESSTISTAEHTMALILASARNVPAAHAATAQGGWERERFCRGAKRAAWPGRRWTSSSRSLQGRARWSVILA